MGTKRILTAASSPHSIPNVTGTAVMDADGPGCRDRSVMDLISDHLDVPGCPQKHQPRACASLCALARNQLLGGPPLTGATGRKHSCMDNPARLWGMQGCGTWHPAAPP